MDSETEIIESHPKRMHIRHTDEGKAIQRDIDQLKALLEAYREGSIKERRL